MTIKKVAIQMDPIEKIDLDFGYLNLSLKNGIKREIGNI